MRLDSRLGMFLSGISGLALPFSFSPFDLFPLAPISVAVLFAVWVRVPPRRAFLCGWIYGLAAYGFHTALAGRPLFGRPLLED